MLDSILLWILLVCEMIVLGALIYFASKLISVCAIMKDIKDYVANEGKQVKDDQTEREPVSPYLNPNTGLYDFHYGKKQQKGEDDK